MPQFLPPPALWMTVLIILAMSGTVAEAKRHKPPKDVPGLEFPILAAISTVGYAGYYYVKSQKRP